MPSFVPWGGRRSQQRPHWSHNEGNNFAFTPEVLLLRCRMTHGAEDKQDRLTSYLADFAVNEWTGQNVGVALHGGGWSASQLEDLERKTKKGEGKKKNKYTSKTEMSRGAAAVRAYSLVSSC